MMSMINSAGDDRQLLLLAITIERHCACLYREWAHRFRPYDNGVSAILDELAKEELSHEQELIDLYAGITGNKVAENLPESEKLNDFIRGLDSVRDHFFVIDPPMAKTILEIALEIERYTHRFYMQLQGEVKDPQVLTLIRRLLEFEEDHVNIFLERL